MHLSSEINANALHLCRQNTLRTFPKSCNIHIHIAIVMTEMIMKCLDPSPNKSFLITTLRPLGSEPVENNPSVGRRWGLTFKPILLINTHLDFYIPLQLSVSSFLQLTCQTRGPTAKSGQTLFYLVHSCTPKKKKDLNETVRSGITDVKSSRFMSKSHDLTNVCKRFCLKKSLLLSKVQIFWKIYFFISKTRRTKK